MVIPQRGGLPHSDIHGSKPARGSPWLFAACHVLHRLLVPRHPPNALIALHTNNRPVPSAEPKAGARHETYTPCTGTITASADQTARTSLTHVNHSAFTQTPLTTAIPPGGTTHGSRHDPFRSDKSPSATTDHTARNPPLNAARPARPSRPTHPGAHQNQIHNTKEQTDTADRPPPHALGGDGHGADRGTTPMKHTAPRRAPPHAAPKRTHQPAAAQRLGDYRIRTDDPLLAKQVLYQLS